MRKLPVIFFLFSILLVNYYPQSQEQEITGLMKKASTDTSAINAIIDITREIKDTDLAVALKYLQQVYTLSEKLEHAGGILSAAQLIGDLYSTMGDVQKGIKFVDAAISKHSGSLSIEEVAVLYIAKASLHNDASERQRALEIFNLALENVRSPELKARLFANRGNSYQAMGNYESALKDYQAALDYYLGAGQLKYATIIYSNFGMIYYNLTEFQKSLEFYKKGLQLAEEFNDPSLLAQSYSNIGATYEKLDSMETAIACYLKGLEFAKRQGDQLKMAQNHLNLGNIYNRQGKYDRALEQFRKSFDICKKNGILYGMMMNYTSMGELWYNTGDFARSASNYDSALTYAKQMDLPNELIQISFGLSGAYEKAGRFKEALELHKSAVKLQDSLFALEKQKTILDLTNKYENEKKEKLIADQQFTITYTITGFVVAAIILVSLVAFLIYRNRRLKQLYLKNVMEMSQTYTHIEPGDEEKNNIAVKNQDVEATLLYNRIIDYLQEKKPWLDPDFNINDLAKSLITNRTYLSSAITKGSGVHFNTLINSYRINEAKRLIIESADKAENIDEIMSKCGFRNRGTFNTSFNKLTGMSPGQFRNYSKTVNLSEQDPAEPGGQPNS